jgi:hypothetical protein
MMANPNASTSIVSSKSSEEKATHIADLNMNMSELSLSHQSLITSYGPVSILWDIENCYVLRNVSAEAVAVNIRKALRTNPLIEGGVIMFSTNADFRELPKQHREDFQKSGVRLVYIPKGIKNAIDNTILVFMFLFARDNPPPSSIMLISGNVNFSAALHILGQRGYSIILVTPEYASVALTSAAKFVLDWPSVACGRGLLSPTKVGGAADVASLNDKDAVLFRGMGMSQIYLNPRVGTVSSDDQMESTMRVQPGDLNGLKGELVKMQEGSKGCMSLKQVNSEYQKHFGQSLNVEEYGVFTLRNLFMKIGDVMELVAKDQLSICLKSLREGHSAL